MNTLTIVTLVIGGFLALSLLFIISIYNNLVQLKALLDEAWSGISVQLKRRYDLIPNLVAVVKQYASHEQQVLTTLTNLRSAALNATTPEAKLSAEQGLSSTLKTLFAVAENYPDLKANTNFANLQTELSAIEHEIQLSRRYYNGTTRNYNIAISSFPTNLISSVLGFQRAPFFELENADEAKNPTIKF